MKTLTIINSILLAWIFLKPHITRLQIQIERTFWEKRAYGITLMLWERPYNDNTSNSGRSLFSFDWGDREKDDIKKAKK